MRIFGKVVGVVLLVAILVGLVWYMRYSPQAVKAARDARRAEENAKRARIMAEDAEERLPPIEEEEAGTHPEPAPPISPEGPYPKAVAAETSYNFGSMARDEERKHSFTIKNEGEAKLLLAKGGTTCKCTIAELPKRELAPGESVDVVIAWTPRDLEKNFRKEARIRTNDPNSTEIRLLVSGQVVQEFNVSPSNEWTFGNVGEGATAEVVSTITTALVDKFQVREIESTHPLLSSAAAPLSEEKLKLLGAKAGYEFKSKLAPGISVGPFTQRLKIKTDLPGDKVIDIPVTAFRAGPLRFLPARGGVWSSEELKLNLGRFAAADGKTVTVPLFVQGLKEDFKITQVTADPTFLEVTMTGDETEDLSRRAYQLKFRFPPKSPPTTRPLTSPGRVVLKTNHPDAAEIVIDVIVIAY
jgi:hypothetical protein